MACATVLVSRPQGEGAPEAASQKRSKRFQGASLGPLSPQPWNLEPRQHRILAPSNGLGPVSGWRKGGRGGRSWSACSIRFSAGSQTIWQNSTPQLSELWVRLGDLSCPYSLTTSLWAVIEIHPLPPYLYPTPRPLFCIPLTIQITQILESQGTQNSDRSRRLPVQECAIASPKSRKPTALRKEPGLEAKAAAGLILGSRA